MEASQKRLANKVAVVTGAQQGIGEAIAVAFAREGARIAVNYLDDKAAAECVVARIEALGSEAIAVAGDVANSGDATRIIDAGHELGGLDVLVNNAGIFPRVDFLDMREAQWDEVLSVNLKGTFLCARAAAQRMVESGSGGAIINIASIVAFAGTDRGVHYTASKAGVVGFTRAVALELAAYRIRVNAIAPGLTDTAQPRYGMTEEELDRAGRALPLGQLAQPGDIADAALFLACDDSRLMTGQTIHINSGGFLS